MPEKREVTETVLAAFLCQMDGTLLSQHSRLLAGAECQLRFVLDDTPEATSLRNDARARVVDLTSTLAPAIGGTLVTQARSGVMGTPTTSGRSRVPDSAETGCRRSNRSHPRHFVRKAYPTDPTCLPMIIRPRKDAGLPMRDVASAAADAKVKLQPVSKAFVVRLFVARDSFAEFLPIKEALMNLDLEYSLEILPGDDVELFLTDRPQEKSYAQ